MINLSSYRLTSRRNGGQWSGPCWFEGIGKDRFTIEPYPPDGGDPKWFCRGCNQCQRGKRSGNYRFGRIIDERQVIMVTKKRKIVPTKSTITLEQALRLTKNLTGEGLAYLKSRGITEETAKRFRLGMIAGRFITIPLVYNWLDKVRCDAIKRRWLPQYHPKKAPKYSVLPGSKPKGVFNFDVLRGPGVFGIIANSLFDVMLLDQLGYPAAGPFSGEADWEVKWSGYIQWSSILNIGDWDEEKKDNKGKRWRPGTQYMLKRAIKLGDAPNVERIINVYPPSGLTDITAMWEAGVDIKKWIVDTLKGETNETLLTRDTEA